MIFFVPSSGAELPTKTDLPPSLLLLLLLPFFSALTDGRLFLALPPLAKAPPVSKVEMVAASGSAAAGASSARTGVVATPATKPTATISDASEAQLIERGCSSAKR